MGSLVSPLKEGTTTVCTEVGGRRESFCLFGNVYMYTCLLYVFLGDRVIFLVSLKPTLVTPVVLRDRWYGTDPSLLPETGFSVLIVARGQKSKVSDTRRGL